MDISEYVTLHSPLCV